ncbi:acetyltransferase, GNAT family protein [Besnoitia besnoiti]|uniref:Acetyltransferase, GNAT family protein n=1 Tax=Besnoitia besnoiti TaxID=94643 RepID=A0A2A9M7F5_BESBE|nr:acetyltransferase, GNAT family protein [Besnoitia besnoiti]PFH33869.1 acetyltransferase, GNAT family protein [Besnoitia besnoiti]
MLLAAGDVLQKEGRGLGASSRVPAGKLADDDERRRAALVTVAAALVSAVSCLARQEGFEDSASAGAGRACAAEDATEAAARLERDADTGEASAAEKRRHAAPAAEAEKRDAVGIEKDAAASAEEAGRRGEAQSEKEEGEEDAGRQKLGAPRAPRSRSPSFFPGCAETVYVDNVLARLQDPAMKQLMEESDSLALRVFDQKCLEVTSKKKKWLLRVLTEAPGASPARPRRCLGFIVYRVDLELQALQVGKVAVLEECRGRGFGKKLVKGIIQLAKSNRALVYVSLSALASAVGFYTRLGFKRHDEINVAQDDEELCASQVYMEMQLRRRVCAGAQQVKNQKKNKKR